MKTLVPTRHLSRRLNLVGMAAMLALTLALPATALAAPATTTTGCGDNVSCIQQFGNAEIAKRQTSLTTMSGKVTMLHNQGLISDANAQYLQSDISTNASGLSALQASLDNPNITEQQARQYVAQIYTTFRIYIVVLPRDYRLLALGVVMHIDGVLAPLEPIIANAIKNAPASEQQQLNALNADFTQQLQEAEAQADAAQGQIKVLTAANYDSDPTDYKTNWGYFVNDETTAHTAVHKAADDVHQIAKILKGTGSASSSTSSTANS